MKALQIHRHGALEEVALGDSDSPRPGPGQVLVRTKAGALNHLDLHVLGGLPKTKLPMPHILGSDGAGVVEECGQEVDSFESGDRVMLNPGVWCGRCEFCLQGEHSLCVRYGLLGESQAGTFAEFFVAPAASLERMPSAVTYPEAAAFSLVFQTAWRMLKTRCRILPGIDVFIHGIGSGVSTACLQIAKLSGARVLVSSGSDDKLDRARRLGADFGCNYRRSDVVREMIEATQGRGADIVVDSVGKETWLQSLKIVRKGGRIVTCGATTGPNPATEIRLIFWKQIEILGSTMSNASEYKEVVRLLGRGLLKPIIDRTFPLSQGREALEYLRQGGQFGKVVLEVGS